MYIKIILFPSDASLPPTGISGEVKYLPTPKVTMPPQIVSGLVTPHSSTGSMLGMVGEAIKQVQSRRPSKDVDKTKPFAVKKKPVPEYNPTPKHLLNSQAKAKKADLEYDPISNFSTYENKIWPVQRVTLADVKTASLKRPVPSPLSQDSDDEAPCKKMLLMPDTAMEAKFSDEDEIIAAPTIANLEQPVLSKKDIKPNEDDTVNSSAKELSSSSASLEKKSLMMEDLNSSRNGIVANSTKTFSNSKDTVVSNSKDSDHHHNPKSNVTQSNVDPNTALITGDTADGQKTGNSDTGTFSMVATGSDIEALISFDSSARTSKELGDNKSMLKQNEKSDNSIRVHRTSSGSNRSKYETSKQNKSSSNMTSKDSNSNTGKQTSVMRQTSEKGEGQASDIKNSNESKENLNVIKKQFNHTQKKSFSDKILQRTCSESTSAKKKSSKSYDKHKGGDHHQQAKSVLVSSEKTGKEKADDERYKETETKNEHHHHQHNSNHGSSSGSFKSKGDTASDKDSTTDVAVLKPNVSSSGEHRTKELSSANKFSARTDHHSKQSSQLAVFAVSNSDSCKSTRDKDNGLSSSTKDSDPARSKSNGTSKKSLTRSESVHSTSDKDAGDGNRDRMSKSGSRGICSVKFTSKTSKNMDCDKFYSSKTSKMAGKEGCIDSTMTSNDVDVASKHLSSHTNSRHKSIEKSGSEKHSSTSSSKHVSSTSNATVCAHQRYDNFKSSGVREQKKLILIRSDNSSKNPARKLSELFGDDRDSDDTINKVITSGGPTDIQLHQARDSQGKSIKTQRRTSIASMSTVDGEEVILLDDDTSEDDRFAECLELFNEERQNDVNQNADKQVSIPYTNSERRHDHFVKLLSCRLYNCLILGYWSYLQIF